MSVDCLFSVWAHVIMFCSNVMKFVTKNMAHCPLTIGYKGKYIEEVVNTKFLDLHLDNHLNWNNHIDQIIHNLSAACYAVR
jgi:hypothetical protein